MFEKAQNKWKRPGMAHLKRQPPQKCVKVNTFNDPSSYTSFSLLSCFNIDSQCSRCSHAMWPDVCFLIFFGHLQTINRVKESFKICPNTVLKPQKFRLAVYNLPKWRNFAQSGLTGSQWNKDTKWLGIKLGISSATRGHSTNSDTVTATFQPIQLSII